MKKHARLTAKSYLVGIPVPYLDRNGLVSPRNRSDPEDEEEDLILKAEV
jgi:hypothetical protein